MKGGLYVCKVERSDPDKEYYLLKYIDVETDNPADIFFLMRKDHAVKRLSVGDTVLVTSTGQKLGRYDVVSQKIPDHVINILNLYFYDILESYSLYLSRVAALRRAKICKVGVWNTPAEMDCKSLNDLFKDRVEEVLHHIPYPVFVPTREKPQSSSGNPWYELVPPLEFVINALYPADLSRILDIQYEPDFRRIFVIVSEKDLPLFLWKDYINAKLASKLTKTAYHFVVSETGQEVVVDVYGVEEYMKVLLS